MKYIIFLTLTTVFFVSPSVSIAEDSDIYIKKMQNSPVSKFDFYIYKLSEKLKCRTDRVSITKTTQSKTPCLTDIEYDSVSNILVMYFYVDSSNRDMKNFKSRSKKKKEKTMLKILNKLAIELGVQGQKVGDETVKLGTIQLTPLSPSDYGGNLPDEYAFFYDEIADITEINLVTNIKSSVYKATRQKWGNYNYKVDKSEK